nr:hypothetical protein [Mycobacterium lepromatosis]
MLAGQDTPFGTVLLGKVTLSNVELREGHLGDRQRGHRLRRAIGHAARLIADYPIGSVGHPVLTYWAK